MELQKSIKANSSGHSCLSLRGKSSECLKCQVMKLGFCHDFVETLENMASDLDSNHKTIPLQDREEILSDIVISVWKGADTFESRNNARFSSWSWSIYKNKRKDYFRRAYRQKGMTFLSLDDNKIKEDLEMTVSAKESISSQDDQEIENIIRCLKRNLANDAGGCIRLYLDLFCTGKDRKELAREYGLKLNTFNQRVRRCRKAIRNLCEEEK